VSSWPGLGVVDDFSVWSVATVGMFCLPPSIGKLISDVVATIEVLPLSGRLGSRKSAVVVRKSLRPDVSQSISVSSVVLSHVIGHRCHAILRFR
jgi:hypothetical protein